MSSPILYTHTTAAPPPNQIYGQNGVQTSHPTAAFTFNTQAPAVRHTAVAQPAPINGGRAVQVGLPAGPAHTHSVSHTHQPITVGQYGQQTRSVGIAGQTWAEPITVGQKQVTYVTNTGGNNTTYSTSPNRHRDGYFETQTHVPQPTIQSAPQRNIQVTQQHKPLRVNNLSEYVVRDIKTKPFWGMGVSDNGGNDMKVESLWKDGPAWKSGLRPGDTITHVNFRAVSNEQDIKQEMLASKVGESVPVHVKRNGQPFQAGITPMTTDSSKRGTSDFYDLQQHQNIEFQEDNKLNAEMSHVVDKAETEHRIQIMQSREQHSFDMHTWHQARLMQLVGKESAEAKLRNLQPFWGASVSDNGNDMKVESMWKDGPAWKSGLRPGDTITHVHGNAMTTEEQIKNEMLASRVGESVPVHVKRNGQPFQVDINPMTTDSSTRGTSHFYDLQQHQKVEYEDEAEKQRLAAQAERERQEAAAAAVEAARQKAEAEAAAEAQRKAEEEAAAAMVAAKASRDGADLVEAQRLKQEAEAAAALAEKERREAEAARLNAEREAGEAAAAAQAVAAAEHKQRGEAEAKAKFDREEQIRIEQETLRQQQQQVTVVKTTEELKEEARQGAPPFWGVSLNQNDAKVKEMWYDGPSYRAGIRPKDQIIRVMGKDVSNYKETLGQMKKTKVGEENTITVLKPTGEKIQYKMTPLTNKPEYKDIPEIYYDTQEGTRNYKIPLAEEKKRELIAEAAAKAPPFWGVTIDEKNAKVISLWEHGPTWNAGIRPGDQIVRVAGVDVKNYKETLTMMKKTKVNETNTITVLKGDGKTKVQYQMTPLTNQPAFENVEEIYFNTSKTGPNRKYPPPQAKANY